MDLVCSSLQRKSPPEKLSHTLLFDDQPWSFQKGKKRKMIYHGGNYIRQPSNLRILILDRFLSQLQGEEFTCAYTRPLHLRRYPPQLRRWPMCASSLISPIKFVCVAQPVFTNCVVELSACIY